MNIQQTTIPSGLLVVTAALPGFTTAAVGAFIRAGARDEIYDNGGIAHFLEHMAFKGTTTRSALQIASQIEILGSDINAYTSYDSTAYHVSGLGQNLPQAIAILGDVLTKSVFDPAEIEKEKGVILQEIARSQDSPNDVAYNNLSRIIYRDQPMGRPILGKPEFIRLVTQQHFQDFVAKNYNTSTLIVVAAGAVDHQTTVELVEQHFSDLPKGTVPVRDVLAEYDGVFVDRSKPFEQVSSYLRFPTVNYASPDLFSVDMLSAVLGGGMSAPLFQEVREKRGLVYSVGCFSAISEDHGDFVVYAGMTPENVDEVIKVSGDVIRAAAERISDEDMTRAKNGRLVGVGDLSVSPFSLAEYLADSYLRSGKIKYPADYTTGIGSVQKEDIQRMAANLLDSPASLSLVGPVVGDRHMEIIARA